ncbi:hypothetical protein JAAARDRAFT_210003 [Jaapia argillacea MUCL 33604]|uniref:G domain-containing protein n=1 Tax=Jaapia argillacea MUCL 33604 TaxID=933084 RepID=A0A067PEH0_9AGAM|nr:hypothetical protein JAAARDRAFT_210003 [Jaapia argillacea MUCL 33604]
MSQPAQSSADPVVQETSPSDLPPLRSTTSQIFEECDRFRILLVGRSGVGKSSLINAIFKIDAASVQDFKAGEATIDKEMSSKENPRFVLHDSQGYQPGEAGNLGTLERFVLERKDKPNKKDRLHAIWLCIATPIAGGRILETGDEKIFKLDRGNVPIIVIFTKCDMLVSKHRQQLCAEYDGAELDRKSKELARKEFDKICLLPLQQNKTKNRLIAYVPLSTKSGYEDSLRTLAKLTQDPMECTIPDEHRKSPFSFLLFWRPSSPKPSPNDGYEVVDPAAIAFGAAQRVNSDLKIHNSIIVGRKKYWRGLGSSVHFFGRTLEKCLVVIHKDIVRIWNIRGLEVFLLEPKFKAEFSKVVEDLSDADAAAIDPNGRVMAIVPKVGAAVGLVGSIAHPGAPIVAPIVAGVLLASWVYDIYRKTPGTVRCLMGYIVGLIIIMHRLFDLMQHRNDLSDESAMQTLRVYSESLEKREIHLAIRNFVDGASIWEFTKKDIVFDQIVSMINEHCPTSVDNGEHSAVRPRVDRA